MRRVDLNNANEEPYRRDGGEKCAQEEDELSDVSGLRVVTDGANGGSVGRVVHIRRFNRKRAQNNSDPTFPQSALKTAVEAALTSPDSAMRRPETALDHGHSGAVAGVIADAMLAHQRGRRVGL